VRKDTRTSLIVLGSKHRRRRSPSGAAALLAVTVLIGSIPVEAWGQSSAPTGPADPEAQLPPVTVQATPSAKKKATVEKASPADVPASPTVQPPSTAARAAEVSAVGTSLALQADGTASDGYRASLISDVGPLGSQPLLTTPFSISVLSKELLENTQAKSIDDVLRLHPFVHNMWPVSRGNPTSAVIRGFSSTTSTMDNMRLQNTSFVNVEGLERVEVLSGLSGFLYGAADPGGVINYVQKSPTRHSFANLTGGLIDESGYAHADFGGAIAPGAGTYYRVNVVRQDGGTAVDHQNIERTYVSGAVDFEISENALLQIKAFHSDFRAEGSDAFWTVPGVRFYPSAPDAGTLYGQPWGFTDNLQDSISTKLAWDINETFTFRGGYMFIEAHASGVSINNAANSVNGTYAQTGIANAAGTLTTKSGYAAVDTHVVTGPLRQTITTGYSEGFYESSLPLDPNFSLGTIGVFNIANPVYVPKPPMSLGTLPESRFFTREIRNIFIGDTIDFGPYVTMTIGWNYATVAGDSYSFVPPAGQPRAFQSRYDESEWTPTYSLVLKPTTWVSVYGMYIEGLEQGSTAPGNAANAGEVLAPYVSEQKEVGVKAELGGALLTLALFDITKAYAFLDPTDQRFKAAGNQNNKGVEIGISGKVLDNLSVFGGFTALDAEVVDDPVLAGKKPVDVPENMFKLYAEYNVPFAPGLTLTGAINYSGEFAAFTDNRQFLPEFVTGDLGFRYETEIGGTPITTRFQASNVTDEDYWMSTRFIGAPRSYALTVEAKF